MRTIWVACNDTGAHVCTRLNGRIALALQLVELLVGNLMLRIFWELVDGLVTDKSLLEHCKRVVNVERKSSSVKL